MDLPKGVALMRAVPQLRWASRGNLAEVEMPMSLCSTQSLSGLSMREAGQQKQEHSV